MPKPNRGGIDDRLVTQVSVPFNQNPRLNFAGRKYFADVRLVIDFIVEMLGLVAEPDGN